jgi:signal transduction histidine kinase
MSYLLHPPLLDEAGFACAAEWYIEGFAKRSGVKVSMDIATDQERLPMSVEIVLFRILQESLTNVHRHSGATQVSVCFLPKLEEIVLEIRDNGRGIPAERLNRLREASAETGVGLAGMHERMHELNGQLEIESDGHGTTLRAILPRRPARTRSDQLRDGAQVALSSVRTELITSTDRPTFQNQVMDFRISKVHDSRYGPGEPKSAPLDFGSRGRHAQCDTGICDRLRFLPPSSTSTRHSASE